ncbi:MAG TPA: hypothetical protein VF600_05450 [Abditibacteriaceae bacterium]|jgi:hypothetical protein
MDEIEQMWQQFAAMPFPKGCGGKEVADVCLASVDTFAAGCVCTFIGWRGRLDAERIKCLQSCIDDLEIVVPLLDGQAKAYFEHLLQVSHNVLQFVG